jgi:hypothetical protein
MAECSVCSKGEETALLVNELLEKGIYLRDIETQTGIGFRSIHRHRHSHKCPFSFSKYKAAKIKSRSTLASGRLLVRWPDGTLTDRESPIAASEVSPNDFLFVVSYQETPLTKFGNPIALISAALISEAEAENAERSSNQENAS